MFWFSFNVMYLGENNGNLSETKNVFYFQPLLKMRKILLDKRIFCLIMSNFYVQILSNPNILTIVTSKKILKMSNYEFVLSIWHTGKTGPRTLRGPRALWGPRTLWGPMNLGLRTLRGPRILGGSKTLGGPRTR